MPVCSCARSSSRSSACIAGSVRHACATYPAREGASSVIASVNTCSTLDQYSRCTGATKCFGMRIVHQQAPRQTISPDLAERAVSCDAISREATHRVAEILDDRPGWIDSQPQHDTDTRLWSSSRNEDEAR